MKSSPIKQRLRRFSEEARFRDVVAWSLVTVGIYTKSAKMHSMVGWRFVVTFVPLFAAMNYWLFLAPIGPGQNHVYDFPLMISTWIGIGVVAFCVEKRFAPPPLPTARRA